MSSLTEFLLARITEDEAVAGAGTTMRADAYARHTALWNGAGHLPVMTAKRLKAECAAKRAIMERHCSLDGDGQLCDWCITHDLSDQPLPWPCPDLLALASVYADHPDYRDEWRTP